MIDVDDAEPHDVAAYLAELDDWADDDLRLYVAATRLQALHQAVADAASQQRAAAVARMNTAGQSYRQIAELVGLTHGRVQQLVERTRVTVDPVGGRPG